MGGQPQILRTDESRTDNTHLVVCDHREMVAELTADLFRSAGYDPIDIINDSRLFGSHVANNSIDIALVHFEPDDAVMQQALTCMVAAGIHTPVVLVADFDGAEHRIWPDSVVTVVSSDASTDVLMNAVDGARRPGGCIDNSLCTGRPSELDERWFLTPRERETLQGLVDGMSTGELAMSLGVRPSTVRGYVQNVLYKLGVSSRLAAAALAVDVGIVHQH